MDFVKRPTYSHIVELNDNAEPVLKDGEIILDKFLLIDLAFVPETVIGTGDLVVTSRRILWISDMKSYAFDVAYIILHAITNDIQSFPKPCLYCQFDEEEDSEEQECFFAPQDLDKTPIRRIFDIFSQAAQMNPDENNDINEEGVGDWIYNEVEVQAGLNAANAAKLQQLDSVFVEPDSENMM